MKYNIFFYQSYSVFMVAMIDSIGANKVFPDFMFFKIGIWGILPRLNFPRHMNLSFFRVWDFSVSGNSRKFLKQNKNKFSSEFEFTDFSGFWIFMFSRQ